MVGFPVRMRGLPPMMSSSVAARWCPSAGNLQVALHGVGWVISGAVGPTKIDEFFRRDKSNWGADVGGRVPSILGGDGLVFLCFQISKELGSPKSFEFRPSLLGFSPAIPHGERSGEFTSLFDDCDSIADKSVVRDGICKLSCLLTMGETSDEVFNLFGVWIPRCS